MQTLTPPLDSTQEKALEKLARTLSDLTEQARNSDELQKNSLSELTINNVIGILGPRGSGKSTILRLLYEKFKTNLNTNKHYIKHSDEDTNKNINQLYFLPPLDCSVINDNISPGIAVLLHLMNALEKIYFANTKQNSDYHYDLTQKTSSSKTYIEDLKNLLNSYISNEQGYKELCQELSSSTQEYSSSVIKGLQERLFLQKNISAWLENVIRQIRHFDHKQTQHLNDRFEGFVVLLDDFDLVSDKNVYRWLQSLLDELRQPRLIFVLTADFYRLEYLSLVPDIRFDDKTGRALLGKLLPPINRLSIDEWSFESRLEFHIQEMRQQDYSDETRGDSLWDRIKKIYGLQDSTQYIVANLIPHRPRGLRNLYHSLSTAKTEEDRSSQEISLNQEFLHLLATTRMESILARRLEEIDADEWIKILRFSKTDLSTEEWDELIETAKQRTLPIKRLPPKLRPLRKLVPISRWYDKNSDKEEITTEIGTESNIVPNRDLPQLEFRNPDSTAPDPLRHDRIRALPLRDAEESAQPLWTELLINIGLNTSAKNRISFLHSWMPIARRLEVCRFHLTLDRDKIRQFFIDTDPKHISKAALIWLKQYSDEIPPAKQKPEDGYIAIDIGWYPLLETLRGINTPFKLLNDFNINNTHLSGDFPAIDDEQTLQLLPDSVAALLLLVDALYRCPWSAFSRPLNWRVITYLGLATALVRSAYLFAVQRSTKIFISYDDLQQQFINCLEKRDPGILPMSNDEELLASLCILFDDNIEENKVLISNLENHKSHTLVASAYNFLTSPAYTAVSELVMKTHQDDTFAVKIRQRSTTNPC